MDHLGDSMQQLSHSHLLQLKNKLGYRKLDGVCTGFSGMLMQAIFANDEETFYNRLKFIASYHNNLDRLVKDIRRVQDKYRSPSHVKPTLWDSIVQFFRAFFKYIFGKRSEKKQTPLQSDSLLPREVSPDDRRLLDVLSFFEGMALYLQPGDYVDAFHQSYISQNDMQEIYAFTKPKSLDKTELTMLLDKSYGFTKQELTEYFQKLAQILDAEKQTTAIMLRSVSHTILLKWSVKERQWELVNVNNLDKSSGVRCYFKADQANLLAESVFQSFIYDYAEKYTHCVFQTQLLTTSPHAGLREKLQTFDSNYSIEQQHAQITNSDGELLYLASRFGRLETVKQLLRQGANVNAIYHGLRPAYRGESALFHACNKGYVDVVHELLNSGADANVVCRGMSPLYKACKNGHLGVVKALLSHGAKVDFIGPKGESLFDIAKGDILEELTKKLNKDKVENTVLSTPKSKQSPLLSVSLFADRCHDADKRTPRTKQTP